MAHGEAVHRGIGAVQLGVELHHLRAADDVAIQVVHLPSQRIERPEGASLLIVARPLCHHCLTAPGGGDLGPTLIPKLVQEQRSHRVRVARCVAQTAVHPPYLAAVVGIGAEQPGARRVHPQITSLQHPPHSTQGVPREPLHRYTQRAQRPAAGSRPALPARHFLVGGLARPSLQSLKQFLLPGFALLDATSATLPTVLVGPKSCYALVLIDLSPPIERVRVPRLQQPLGRHRMRCLTPRNL